MEQSQNQVFSGFFNCLNTNSECESGTSGSEIWDSRRTAATRLLDGRTNHITIAAILGHSDLRMIMRYTKASTAVRGAVKALEKPNRAKIVPVEIKEEEQEMLNA